MDKNWNFKRFDFIGNCFLANIFSIKNDRFLLKMLEILDLWNFMELWGVFPFTPIRKGFSKKNSKIIFFKFFYTIFLKCFSDFFKYFVSLYYRCFSSSCFSRIFIIFVTFFISFFVSNFEKFVDMIKIIDFSSKC